MMDFHTQNVKEARQNVLNRLQSIKSSNERINQPYYPPLITKNRSGQPFFINKDDSKYSSVSVEGAGFRLSDVDYEKQRKKILERLSTDYQLYNASDTSVAERREKIVSNDDVSVYVSDLILDNIVNKLITEKFNKDLINELNKFRAFIITNVYKFADFDVFNRYIDKLQQVLNLLRSFQAEGIQKNIKWILGSVAVDKETLQKLKNGELPDEFVVEFAAAFDDYILTMTKIIETLIDYLRENSKGIGQSTSLRKQLAAALVKTLGLSDKNVNIVNKKIEKNFELLEKEFAPIPLGRPLKTDPPLTRTEKLTQELIQLLTKALQKQTPTPTPTPPTTVVAPPTPTPTPQITQQPVAQITQQPVAQITQQPIVQPIIMQLTPKEQQAYLSRIITKAVNAGLDQTDIDDIGRMVADEYNNNNRLLDDVEIDNIIFSYTQQAPIVFPATTTTPQMTVILPSSSKKKQKKERKIKAQQSVQKVIQAIQQQAAQQAAQQTAQQTASSSQAASSSQPPPLTPQQKAAQTRARNKAAIEALKKAAAQRQAQPVSKTPQQQAPPPQAPPTQVSTVPKGGTELFKMTNPTGYTYTENEILNLDNAQLDRLLLLMTDSRTPLDRLKKTLNERLGLQNSMEVKNAVLFVLYMRSELVDFDGEVIQNEPNYF